MREMLRFLLLMVSLFVFLPALMQGGIGVLNAPSALAASTPPSTSLQVSGLVRHPGTLKLADIQALPKVTVTTNARPVGRHSYTGALLYDLLQRAQVISDPKRKNDLLRKGILIGATDGYAVAVAWGEIDPHFAGKRILVAYEEDGKPLPAALGFVSLVVPGDVLAGRYVHNINSIVVRDVGEKPILGTRKPSISFTLAGLVKKPATYDLKALQALKPATVTITGKDESGKPISTTYTGVLLNDLWQKAGFVLKPGVKNAFLRQGVIAIGSDGYSALIVNGELNPRFGNVPILVAYAVNGHLLPPSDGFARLVVPGDLRQGRYVSNLVKLQVVDL